MGASTNGLSRNPLTVKIPVRIWMFSPGIVINAILTGYRIKNLYLFLFGSIPISPLIQDFRLLVRSSTIYGLRDYTYFEENRTMYATVSPPRTTYKSKLERKYL